MNPEAEKPPETITAKVKLSSADWQLEASVNVPSGPTTLRAFLPAAQELTNLIVGTAVQSVEAEGRTISCCKGCGACCRQLVPISEVEARQIGDLVAQMPEPRRSTVRARFAAARDRLEESGILDKLLGRAGWTESGEWVQALGTEYFRLGIACPFLEEESCSIHPDRPISCREYLVTSPAQNCARPSAKTIDLVELPMKVWTALARCDRPAVHERFLRWVPLILAPEWAEANPEEPPPRPGPELLQEFFDHLTHQKISPAGAPADESVASASPASGASRPTNREESLPASSAAFSSYDELPYTDQPYDCTHPDALATVATLRGMSPPRVDRCRVLELGCGAGGNLIGMALSLPESRFVGVDLSLRQIDAGRRIVDTLRLTNIELRQLSILDIDSRFGQFDYIICHGVYSWAPPAVQDRILAICGENLAAQGVAYVSYNTYPGWHARGAIREMLCFHARRFGSPGEKVRESRKFLDFLEQSIPNRDGFYLRFVQHELEMLRPEADTYVFHEHLEEINQPSYFHEFAASAAAHGLQYLGESRPDAVIANLAADVVETVAQNSEDPIEQEQYFDFICNRTFRRSLLSRNDVPVERAFDPRQLTGLCVTALTKPETEAVEVHSDSVAKFRTKAGTTVSTNNPLMKAALIALANAAPQAVRFEDLWAVVAPDIPPDGPQNRESLAKALLHCYRSNLVELHVHPPAFLREPSSHPVASPLARLQAASGEVVTSLRHRSVRLSDADRLVLQELDGSHDRTALLAMLTALVERGDLGIHSDGQELLDPGEKENALRAVLEHSLEYLGRSALIVR